MHSVYFVLFFFAVLRAQFGQHSDICHDYCIPHTSQMTIRILWNLLIRNYVLDVEIRLIFDIHINEHTHQIFLFLNGY
jgi:hypothetical protein